MQILLLRIAFILSITASSLMAYAIQAQLDSDNLNIPQEIIDRLPEEQIASFILGRQKILKRNPEKDSSLSMYEEINVSHKAIARIPDDQLFTFLADLGYIQDVSPAKNMHTTHIENSPPSPEQLIQLLFWLVGGALLIILVSIYLAHRRRIGEQDVVLRALEVGEEIPIALFDIRRQKSFMRWGILFLTIAGVMMLYGMISHVPMGILVIPASLGAGFLLAGILVKD